MPVSVNEKNAVATETNGTTTVTPKALVKPAKAKKAKASNLKAKVAQAKAKAKPKKAKGPAPKASKTVQILGKTLTRIKGNNHIDDDAFAVAKASEGRVNTLQVRMLRALRKAKGPLTRKDLKVATNHWPHRDGYHIKWVAKLMEMTPRFVKVEEHEPVKGELAKHHYTITAIGRGILEKAEKAS